VDQALGPAGAAGGVEDLGRHPLRRADRPLASLALLQPGVAAGLHLDRGLGPAGHQDVLDHVQALDRLVGDALERDRPGAAQALVGGDQHPGSGIDDPVAQGLGAEAGEDHRVHRADAGAGQHADREVRHHRQVQADPVALLHPQVAQQVGGAADPLAQLRPADALVLAGLVAGPEDGGAGGVALGVPIDAVDRDVEAPAGEPAQLAVGEVLQHIVGLAVPAQRARLLAPEGLQVEDALPVHQGVRVEGAG